MGDMFAALPRVFFLYFWLWLAHGWTGKKGHGHVAFLFWCLFCGCCVCCARRWLGSGWFGCRGGRRGREMEPCLDDEREWRKEVVCELRRLGLNGRQGDDRFLHRLTVVGVRRFC